MTASHEIENIPPLPLTQSLEPTFPFGSFVRIKSGDNPWKKNSTINAKPSDYLTVVSTHFISVPHKNKVQEIVTVGLRTTCCSPLNRFFSIVAPLLETDEEMSRPRGCGKHLFVAGDSLLLNQSIIQKLQHQQRQCTTHGVVLWSTPQKTALLLPDMGTFSIQTEELIGKKHQHPMPRKWVEKVSEGDFVRPTRNYSRLLESWRSDIRGENGGKKLGWEFGFVSSRTRVRSTLQGRVEWGWWFELVVMEGEAKGKTIRIPEEMAILSFLSEDQCI